MIGGNLYNLAASVIGRSDYTFFSALPLVTDARGFDVPSYAVGVALRDSIQAVPRTLYRHLGLDLDRYYIMIYTDNPLLVLERGTSGDQIEFNSERFQLLSDADWTPIDKWRGVLAVRQNVTISP